MANKLPPLDLSSTLHHHLQRNSHGAKSSPIAAYPSAAWHGSYVGEVRAKSYSEHDGTDTSVGVKEDGADEPRG